MGGRSMENKNQTVISKEARISKEDRGATMIEYVLLAALIAIALIVALNLVQQGISNEFSQVSSALESN